MSVSFNDYGDSATVTINGTRMFLDDDAVTQLWCQTARLYDNFHNGSARVFMGDTLVSLSHEQWTALYDYADAFIDRAFIAHMMEEEVPEKTLH
jgi:hypothetical protein